MDVDALDDFAGEAGGVHFFHVRADFIVLPDLADGDECRGEGSASESGNMFVNVAGKSGENVKFKLYNKQTGELTDLNESLKYSNMAGSLSDPVHLTSDEVTTGVSFANTKGTDTIEIHDITGRKVNSMTHGVYVVKYNNGVRKVKK